MLQPPPLRSYQLHPPPHAKGVFGGGRAVVLCSEGHPYQYQGGTVLSPGVGGGQADKLEGLANTGQECWGEIPHSILWGGGLSKAPKKGEERAS